MSVDFDSVRRNAAAQGVPLSEISIFYENLTDEEIAFLDESGLIVSSTRREMIVARFGPDGEVAFPDKASGVYSLAS
jgi:hypothetical protein